jgi:non-homologous end joining protein Ku
MDINLLPRKLPILKRQIAITIPSYQSDIKKQIKELVKKTHEEAEGKTPEQKQMLFSNMNDIMQLLIASLVK